MDIHSLEDILKLIAPGSQMREGLNRILEQGHGGLLVIATEENVEEVISSGFKMEARLTPQTLSELSKMDGALVIGEDLSTIIYSNVHLSPDSSIQSEETGTRHKAAEQTSKQLNLPTIAISERRDRITVYFKSESYVLRDIDDILSKVNQALLILGQYRDDFAEDRRELTAMEISGRVLPFHVAQVLRHISQMLHMEEKTNRMFIELGEEKELPQRQLENLMVGVESDFEYIIKDYKTDEKEMDTQEVKRDVMDIPSEELLSTEKVMKPLGYDKDDLDRFLSPRGFRLLETIPRLPSAVIERIVDKFSNLENVLHSNKEELKEVKGIAEARANNIEAGLRRLENRVVLREEMGE